MKTYYFYASKESAAIYGGGWSESEAQADTVGNCGSLKGELFTCDKKTGLLIEEEGDAAYAEAMTAAMELAQKNN